MFGAYELPWISGSSNGYSSCSWINNYLLRWDPIPVLLYCEVMFGAYELPWISGSNKGYSPCSWISNSLITGHSGVVSIFIVRFFALFLIHTDIPLLLLLLLIIILVTFLPAKCTAGRSWYSCTCFRTSGQWREAWWWIFRKWRTGWGTPRWGNKASVQTQTRWRWTRCRRTRRTATWLWPEKARMVGGGGGGERNKTDVG